ncbi:hypothetical protein LEP1GSC072_0782 [Leptospira noguchii str. Bonito]|nr:hypothetical protein LEP1GSC072_0782 [Leptospira noguchii str. Bonito]
MQILAFAKNLYKFFCSIRFFKLKSIQIVFRVSQFFLCLDCFVVCSLWLLFVRVKCLRF